MKRSVEDLAIFGGPPAFQQLLHVGRPNIGDRGRLMARFDDILDRRWLSNDGPYVREFEQHVEHMLGVRHCIAAANGTLALEIAARACGLSGEVIIPSFTFVATAHALAWLGLTPVFCDIDVETHNIDPAAVEALISPRTSGIVGVHVWGRPAAVHELQRIAARHNLHLLFDAAHALGCSAGGRMIGNFGDAEVLSFHATKFVNAGEGGAIVTNDDDLAGRARRLRNFGFSGGDLVTSCGTNAKMPEFCAAMGITSLEAIEEFVEANRRNYLAYQREVRGTAGIHLLEYNQGERSNYQYVVIEIDENARLSRDQLLRVLLAEGIIARRYFYPGCHRMEPYRSLQRYQDVRLPVTEQVAARLLQLPTGTATDHVAISTISGIVRMAVERADEIQRLDPAPAGDLYAQAEKARAQETAPRRGASTPLAQVERMATDS